MGVYYYYVNHSKRELFPVDCFGGPIKHNGIGRGLTARALALMLLEHHGRWAKDEVVVLGDDHHDDWHEIKQGYTDVSANAILTIAVADGFEEILECADTDNKLFMQLCHMMTTNQIPQWQHCFLEHFGKDYSKKYRELCHLDQQWTPSELVDSEI